MCILPVIQSCIGGKETLSIEEDREISLTLKSSDEPSDKEVLGRAESIIRRAWVYAFADGRFVGMADLDDIDRDSFTIPDFRVPKTGSLMIYVLANPAGINNLALVNDQAAFADMSYSMSASFPSGTAFNSSASFSSDSFCLPAFGQTDSPLDVSGDGPFSVTVPVTRSLARVDVLLRRTENTQEISIDDRSGLSISNTREYGFLSPFQVASESSLKDIRDAVMGPETPLQVGQDDPVRAYTFYTPERECGEKMLGFSMSGVLVGNSRKDYSGITVGNGHISRIERNKIYKITCTFTPTSVTPEIAVKVEDWDSKNAAIIFN